MYWTSLWSELVQEPSFATVCSLAERHLKFMLTPATLWSVNANVLTGVEMPQVSCVQPVDWVLVVVHKRHIFKVNFHPSPIVLITMALCHHLKLSQTGFLADLQKLCKKYFWVIHHKITHLCNDFCAHFQLFHNKDVNEYRYTVIVQENSMSFFVLLFTAIIKIKQSWFHYLSSFLKTTFQGYEVMTLCKLSKSSGGEKSIFFIAGTLVWKLPYAFSALCCSWCVYLHWPLSVT